MPRKALTDSQLWLIMNTPRIVTDDALAEAIGTTPSAVHAARWRLKRHGWTCRVSYGTCAICNQPFTRQGHRAGRREYHLECRPTALKQLMTKNEQQRWERRSQEERQALLARAQQHTIDKQAQTVGNDHNRMRRWQPWEDEAILAPDAPPDQELAVELGRTLYAVRGRRALLTTRLTLMSGASEASRHPDSNPSKHPDRKTLRPQ